MTDVVGSFAGSCLAVAAGRGFGGPPWTGRVRSVVGGRGGVPVWRELVSGPGRTPRRRAAGVRAQQVRVDRRQVLPVPGVGDLERAADLAHRTVPLTTDEAVSA